MQLYANKKEEKKEMLHSSQFLMYRKYRNNSNNSKIALTDKMYGSNLLRQINRNHIKREKAKTKNRTR